MPKIFLVYIVDIHVVKSIVAIVLPVLLRILYGIVVPAALAPPLLSQSIPYRLYSQFASSTIYAIHQDARGYMWFGTATGVNRYDGVNIAHYGQQSGFASTYVTSIAEDRAGRIYFGTWGGGLHYLSGGTLRRYSDPRGIIPPKIKYLMVDHRNRLWVGNNYELIIIDTSKCTVLDFGPPQNANSVITSVCEQRNGDMLIGTITGVYRISGNTCSPVRFTPAIDRPVHAIVEADDGSLWMSTEGMLHRAEQGAIVEKRATIDEDRIWILKRDSRGRIWGAGTRTGAFLLEGDSVRNISRLLTFRSVEITALCEDHEGNMWIGTYGMGACCISDFRCLHYTTKDGLSNNYVLDLETGTSGELMIGTRDGLNILSGDTIRMRALPDILKNQPSRYTTLLTYDSTGALWACQNHVIFRRRRNSWEPLLHKSIFRLLYCDREGVVWAGQQNGEGSVLHRFNGREFEEWTASPDLQRRRVEAMYQDRSRRLWFATDSGAYVYDGTRLLHYHTGNGLVHNAVSDIVETDDALWIATRGGLSQLAATGWRHYTRSDGLSSNDCSHLLADSGGVIWVGTYRGLNKIAGNRITVYDTDDGLVSNEIQALRHGGTGTLWIGTVRGITKFSTQDGTASPTQLPLYITGVRAGENFYSGMADIRLPYNMRTFSIEYIGISYRQPQEMRYRYTIIGLDDRMQQTSSRTVQFSSLPSGSYTFIVQAQGRSDRWSHPAVLNLVIETPFWEQWWFRGGIFVLSALVLVVLVQWRARVQQRREVARIAAQYRILQLEQKALHALMNPHFVFNALNSIHRLLQLKDEEQAGQYLTRFAKLIRMTFESAQSTYIVLEEELRRLELYLSLEKMRFEERLSYRITVDPQVDVADVYVPSMILQPYVENAILHGILPVEEGGVVEVEIRQQNSDYLLIIIEDNGIGITASQHNKKSGLPEHRSSAMLLTEERLKLLARMAGLNITLVISDRPTDSEGRGGTRVEITMPVNIADAAG